ncbi:hypothetical protein [Dysgonomonas sp. HGC4]|uniref:hypothetical protein n=1 Tax=Dysgonomonas sp. HGC4 TaxID=1658009 RepID=UPI000682113B|nr:hypothetical protein [Dysgonomonas sp. HGC4]MBD8348979.1 hypothetical protein [Dysgonomonas sp. HGC4]
MNLTTILKRFKSQDKLYNGFQAQTLDDVRAYSTYLNNLHDEYFIEIKEHIDKIILKDNPLSILRLYLQGKISDFNEVEQKRNLRNDEIDRIIEFHKQKLEEYPNNGFYGITLPTLMIKNYQLVQNYFNNIVDSETLLRELSSHEKEYKDMVSISYMMEKSQRDLIQKSIGKINELYTFYFPESTKVQDKQNLFLEKCFSDYLHHDKKDALMEKLHGLIDGKKGKLVATIIKSLEKLSFIGGYENRSTLYNAMRNEFGDIGANAGLNDFIANDYKISEIELNKYIDILKTIK